MTRVIVCLYCHISAVQSDEPYCIVLTFIRCITNSVCATLHMCVFLCLYVHIYMHIHLLNTIFADHIGLEKLLECWTGASGGCKETAMKYEVEIPSLCHLRFPNSPYTSILKAFRNNEGNFFSKTIVVDMTLQRMQRLSLLSFAHSNAHSQGLN